MTVTGTDWLLPFASSDFSAPNGDGRPWGDGTAIAARANPEDPSHGDPWDTGCGVTTFVGGQAAMDAYTVVLRQVITAAPTSSTSPYINGAWARGHVYIAGWRFNCLRDIPTNTNAWDSPPAAVDQDDVAIGLVRRLMQAGVQVRLIALVSLGGSSPSQRNRPELRAAQGRSPLCGAGRGGGEPSANEPMAIARRC